MEPTTEHRYGAPLSINENYEQRLGYYHYHTETLPGANETFPYEWAMAATPTDPLKYGSYWYGRDVGASMAWDSTVPSAGYDPRMLPSSWPYEYYNNQQFVETMPGYQQAGGMYVQNPSFELQHSQIASPAPSQQGTSSDSEYFTAEFKAKFQTMPDIALGSDFFTWKQADCKAKLEDIEYAITTPPLSPVDCVPLENALSPPAQTNNPDPIDEPLLPYTAHSNDLSALQKLQEADITPQPRKSTTETTKRRPKDHLWTEWSCEQCNKWFVRRVGLIQHNRVKHGVDRPYGCTKCGKRFADPAQLEQHIHRHQTTNKPFKCSVCPKQFFYRMDLVRHMYKHTGAAPHVCGFCSKAFSRKDHLLRHELIHKRSIDNNK